MRHTYSPQLIFLVVVGSVFTLVAQSQEVSAGNLNDNLQVDFTKQPTESSELDPLPIAPTATREIDDQSSSKVGEIQGLELKRLSIIKELAEMAQATIRRVKFGASEAAQNIPQAVNKQNPESASYKGFLLTMVDKNLERLLSQLSALDFYLKHSVISSSVFINSTDLKRELDAFPFADKNLLMVPAERELFLKDGSTVLKGVDLDPRQGDKR